MYRLGGQLHGLALALQVVGTVAGYLAGGVFGRHLLDVADETGEHLLDAFAGDVRGGEGLLHLMLHVVAGGGGSQLQGGGIFLGVQLQALYLLGLLARAEYEHTGGQRVEGAGMANLHPAHTYLTRYACAHESQGAERGHAVGLVDVYVFAFCEIHQSTIASECPVSSSTMMMPPTMMR